MSLLAPCLVRLNTNTCFHSLWVIRWHNNSAFCFLSTGQIQWSTVSTVVFGELTDTSIGSLTSPLASLRMSSEKVAENNRFCRCLGSTRKIFLISWIKPISSIRSASSRINTSRLSNFTAFWLYRSSSRPGVATSTSTPWRSRCICGLIFTPPKTTLDRIGKFLL